MKQGQALIAVLLILAVIMTVSLSIASRSTTEVSVSTAQEEAARALVAAEAGVEAKLGGITAGSGTVGVNGSTYNVLLTPFGAVSTPLVLPQLLASGESVSVNLTGYGASSIGVCWSGGNAGGDLETSFYYGNPVVVARDYSAPAGNCPGYSGYNFRTVSVAGSPELFLKLKLLKNTTKGQLVVIPAAINLPTQGDTITSVGLAGGSARKVQVNKQDDRPGIFDTALFSGGSLVK